ncbi:MAG: DUF4426 domain-containing protein [Gammaproteobacteria bacterium]|nr:DUF4426 domain-containing protein [Gammaproteobacteria bacterium]
MNNPMAPRLSAGIGVVALVLLGLAHSVPVQAEQFQQLGRFEAHYSVIPTTLLKPAIAADYDITRARDRALVNIALIDPQSGPVPAEVSGSVRDLLSLERPLAFTEVREGEAVYYLATIEHGDEETMRFFVDVETPDGTSHRLEFQQKLYWTDR